MANFSKIFEIKGVVMAGEFSSDGEIIAYHGDFPLELASHLANICAINNQTNKYLLRNVEELSSVKNHNSTILNFEKFYLSIFKDIFLLADKDKICMTKILNIDLDSYKAL